MDRVERLINLTAALLETEKPLNRHQLQERVPGYSDDPEAFRRAFERDKELLRSMGIPIEVNEAMSEVGESFDGYKIAREKYELPQIDLTQDELRAINVAVAAVQLDTSQQMSALRKLGGQLAVEDKNVDLASIDTSPLLPKVFSAINEKRTMTFTYRGETRTVDPLRLSHQRGNWYIRGFDHDRNEERSFRIDRVDSIDKLSDAAAFDRIAKAESPVPPWLMGDGDPIEVELQIDAEQSETAARQLDGSATSRVEPDGSTVFTVQVTSQEAFRGFVLSFLDHAVVLSPEDVRNDLTGWLSEFVA